MTRKHDIQKPGKPVAEMSDKELRERFPDFPFHLLEPGESMWSPLLWERPDDHEGPPNRPRQDGETRRRANRQQQGGG